MCACHLLLFMRCDRLGKVALRGVLRLEHTPDADGCGSHDRLRVIYLACPKDSTAPLKRKPDRDSKGAAACEQRKLPTNFVLYPKHALYCIPKHALYCIPKLA